MSNREQLSSRLGFLLLSAGCAIGLGNIWRFPYICGQYGGAFFVLIYLFFLAILGFPVMMMELAVGRASQKVLPLAYESLALKGKGGWKIWGNILFLGNFFLLAFYPVITGWLLKYTIAFCSGAFATINANEVGKTFGDFLNAPGDQLLYAGIALLLTALTCFAGLQKSVERVTKFLMAGLFLLMIAMVIQAMLLPDASAGLNFFMKPSMENLKNAGIWNAVHAAMSQAFFTLSLGIGSIAIFGSYIDKTNSLVKESLCIIGLDTFVAICSGLIIFPSCFAFGVKPDAGPTLIFITLPKIFLGNMTAGNVRGAIFFVFMSISAMTTLIAVAENIIAYFMETFKMRRSAASWLVCIILFIGAIPCALGFNIWSGFHPLGGESSVLDLEDFIVSDNLLPLGALTLSIFCTKKLGWGFRGFRDEVNAGKGWKIPTGLQWFFAYILPVLILLIWAMGIAPKIKLALQL